MRVRGNMENIFFTLFQSIECWLKLNIHTSNVLRDAKRRHKKKSDEIFMAVFLFEFYGRKSKNPMKGNDMLWCLIFVDRIRQILICRGKLKSDENRVMNFWKHLKSFFVFNFQLLNISLKFHRPKFHQQILTLIN